MSMTATSRKEMNKLRELVHFLLHGAGASYREGTHGAHGPIVCYFCRKSLAYADDFTTHGNATGPKLAERISIHHVNGNHDDNDIMNKALCHLSCHKGHHRRISNEQKALARAIEAGESSC